MKKTTIIIIICSALLILRGIGILIFTTSNKIPSEQEPKVAKKELVDGNTTNIEESLMKQHIYNNYRFKSLQIFETGDFYAIEFIVDNISNEVLEHNHLSFSFLDSNGKLLEEVEIEIPSLDINGSQKVLTFSGTKKIFDAFDYKISPPKQAKLREKN